MLAWPPWSARSPSWSTPSPPASPPSGRSVFSPSGTAQCPPAFEGSAARCPIVGPPRRRARPRGPSESLAAERSRTPDPSSRRCRQGAAHRHPRRPHRTGRGRRGRPDLTRPEPLTPDALAVRLAELLARTTTRARDHRAPRRARRSRRRPAGPWPPSIAAELPALGGARPSSSPLPGFYRPASLRLEHGRTDPDARYTDWLDAGALAREVLNPLGRGGVGQLPAGALGPGAGPGGARPTQAMPERRGAARARVAAAGRRAGVRRRRPPARRAGRTTAAHPTEQAWELPAFDRYDDEVDPAALADAVVLGRPSRPPRAGARRPLQLNSPATQRSRMCRAIDTGGRQRPRTAARAQFVAGEPAGLLDLVRVEAEVVGARRRARRSPASATAGTATAGCRRSGCR